MSYVDCVLLSSLEVTTPHPDDLALAAALHEQSIETRVVPWESFIESGIETSLVVFRTTWGYYKRVQEFKRLLDHLEAHKVETWNPIDTLRWNYHKRYLLQLEKKGIGIVPSFLHEKGKPLRLIDAAEKLDTDLLVIKPAIGASAYHTHLVNLSKIGSQSAELDALSTQHDLLIQPFIPEVQSEGEFSLVFIDQLFTHSILKVPADQDFIVSGGVAKKIPCPPKALSTAKKILRVADQENIYARVDLVWHEDRYLLMELELIEPQLWLPLEPSSSELLASAISKRL